MPHCDFNNPRLTCPTCGYRARRLPTHRECRPVPPRVWQPVAIGDWVEGRLRSVGVTKERVERLTRTAGKPGGCGCEGRKRWLNETGFKVQRAVRQAAQAAAAFCFAHR